MKKTCDEDCFNCKYDDCIKEGISSKEREEANKRDLNFTYYGSPARSHSSGKKFNNRNYYGAGL